MLRRRWKLLASLTLVGLALGSLAAVRASDDESATEVPVFYAANHRLLADPVSGNQVTLSQAALFATAGEVPTNVAATLDRDRFDVLARVATVEAKDVGTLTLSAVGSTPDEASLISTTFADELVAFLLAQDQAAFGEAVATVEEEIAEHLAVVEALDNQIVALQPAPEILEDGTEAEPEPVDDGSQLELLEAERTSRIASYEGALSQLDAIRSTPPRAAFTTLEISEPFTISEAAYQRRLRAGRTGEANFTSPDQLADGRGGFTSGLADNPFVLVFGGALAGFLLGMVIVLTLARMDHRILSKEEAEEYYGLPVIAEVPQLRRTERRSSEVVSFTEPMSRVAEAYRSLRSSLVYSREVGDQAAAAAIAGRRPEVVMITSANAAEGKTSTAANLAAVLAEGGYSVLAVNCDFRRPQLVHYLQGAQEPRKVSETEIPGVMMINHVTAKGPEALPSDVVQAQRQIIERARGRFDVILLDTAPLLATNDANELLPATDLVLVVAHVGRSTKEAGEATHELLLRRAAPVVGVVLLGVRDTTSAKSYYYYSSERPSRSTKPSVSRRKRARQRAEPAAAREEARARVDRDLPSIEPGLPTTEASPAQEPVFGPDPSPAVGATEIPRDRSVNEPRVVSDEPAPVAGPPVAVEPQPELPRVARSSLESDDSFGRNREPPGDWPPLAEPAVSRRRRRRRRPAPVDVDSAGSASAPQGGDPSLGSSDVEEPAST